MYILDTNICIYLMKNMYPIMTDKIFSMNPELFHISAVTVYELEYGIQKSQYKEKNERSLCLFLAPFTILPFDSRDAYHAAMIRKYLEQNGNIIGPYDIQIASQGLSRNLTVITHNTSEFNRIPNLITEDWAC